MERTADPNRGLFCIASFSLKLAARQSENAQLCLSWKGKKVDPISTLQIADAVQCVACGRLWRWRIAVIAHRRVRQSTLWKTLCPSYVREQKCVCVCKISNSSNVWIVGRHLQRQGWSWMQAVSVRKKEQGIYLVVNNEFTLCCFSQMCLQIN